MPFLSGPMADTVFYKSRLTQQQPRRQVSFLATHEVCSKVAKSYLMHAISAFAVVLIVSCSFDWNEFKHFLYSPYIYKQETHHEMKIPERDETYIVISLYLLMLIHR